MREPLVLYFHHVGVRQEDHYTSISTDQFQLALDLIQQVGEIVALNDAMSVNNKTDIPRFIITFDDGYEDTFCNVSELLAERHVSATHFIITDRIGRTKAAPWGNEARFASPDTLRSAARLGHTISSHTHTHRRLSGLSQSEVNEEISQSESILSSILGEAFIPGVVAYPYGAPPTCPAPIVLGFCTGTVPLRPWRSAPQRIRRDYLNSMRPDTWKESIKHLVGRYNGLP